MTATAWPAVQLVDWHFPASPVNYPPPQVRTATACNIPGCECIEFVDGTYIYPFKHCKGGCTHTENSHGKDDEPAKKPKKVRR